MAVRTERTTLSDVVVDDCPVGIVSQRGTIRGRAPVFIIAPVVSGLLTATKTRVLHVTIIKRKISLKKKKMKNFGTRWRKEEMVEKASFNLALSIDKQPR